MSEAQQKWFANAERRIGKQAWLATMPFCNATECESPSLQAGTSGAVNMQLLMDTMPATEAADMSAPRLLSEAQLAWLAKAHKHTGKQNWLATMPWYDASNADASSPQTAAEHLSGAQRDWLAKAEKRIGKQAWLATLPLKKANGTESPLPHTGSSAEMPKQLPMDANPVTKADMPLPQPSPVLLSQEQNAWLAKAKRKAGKQHWLATMPWYKALMADTASPHMVSVDLSEAQRTWLAKAEKRTGKQAWLASVLFQSEGECEMSPQKVADDVHKKVALTKSIAKAEMSLPQPVALPLSAAQCTWLAKAENHIGKRAWLATLPLCVARQHQASSPMKSIAENKLHANMKQLAVAQLKWLAMAEKRTGKKAWLATLPWYTKPVESNEPVDAEVPLPNLFPATILQCSETQGEPNFLTMRSEDQASQQTA
eukprot:gnl/TRDRNA2_/TRDRNA2_173307_c1_seq1.p1 gnl/TRDRNA2_/TRDRNA2_173307_c1~~gnl/TRDRNA2_/TRDRNA2_173307_c1_seq1.p1  ORF type:complete len:451 (-),score=109.74 gnl/TRDRNA2_/TRDRNA2_173307_c1_seq1:51-1331(-)